MMNEEGAFPRLLELILGQKDDDAGLHRMLLELLYEMSRLQRLRTVDLSEHVPILAIIGGRDLTRSTSLNRG